MLQESIKKKLNKMKWSEEMLMCQECGNVFEENEVMTVFEKHGFELGGFEEFNVCPQCRSTDFEECKGCLFDFAESVEKDYEDMVKRNKEKTKTEEFLISLDAGLIREEECRKCM